MTIKEFKVICYAVSEQSVTNNISADIPEDEWGCSVFGGDFECIDGGERQARHELALVREELKEYGIRCRRTVKNDECTVRMDIEWRDNRGRRLPKPLGELVDESTIEWALEQDSDGTVEFM